jgi:hypothetical protein
MRCASYRILTSNAAPYLQVAGDELVVFAGETENMLWHLSCHFRHVNLDDLVRPARSVLSRKSDTELMSDSLEYAVARVEDDHRLGPQTLRDLGADSLSDPDVLGVFGAALQIAK